MKSRGRQSLQVLLHPPREKKKQRIAKGNPTCHPETNEISSEINLKPSFSKKTASRTPPSTALKTSSPPKPNSLEELRISQLRLASLGAPAAPAALESLQPLRSARWLPRWLEPHQKPATRGRPRFLGKSLRQVKCWSSTPAK